MSNGTEASGALVYFFVFSLTLLMSTTTGWLGGCLNRVMVGFLSVSFSPLRIEMVNSNCPSSLVRYLGCIGYDSGFLCLAGCLL